MFGNGGWEGSVHVLRRRRRRRWDRRVQPLLTLCLLGTATAVTAASIAVGIPIVGWPRP